MEMPIESADVVDLEIVAFRQKPHPGAPQVPPAKIPRVGERLMWLEDKHDGLTAEVVVNDAATVKSSPLRRLIFDTDDLTAAKNWRLQRARWLIRSMDVVFKLPDGELQQSSAFFSVRLPEDRRRHKYVRVMKVTQDLYFAESAKEILRSQLMSLMESLRLFEEFQEVVKAIKKLN